MWSILLGLVHLNYIIYICRIWYGLLYMCGPSIPFGTSHPIRVKNPLWVRILVSYTIYRGSLLSLMHHTVIQNKSNLPSRLSEVRWEESRRLPIVSYCFLCFSFQVIMFVLSWIMDFQVRIYSYLCIQYKI